jgi:hypothetical protein
MWKSSRKIYMFKQVSGMPEIYSREERKWVKIGIEKLWKVYIFYHAAEFEDHDISIPISLKT